MGEVLDPTDDIVVTALRAAWSRHIGGPVERFDDLVARHREEHRRYHDLDHVAHVVATVDLLAPEVELSADAHADAVAAALYHDAVYNPHASTNEQDSAALARRDLSAIGWPAARVDAIASMIEGTATHQHPAAPSEAVLFDADLAILGTDPDTYEKYRSAVREEFAHVTDDAWRTGRPNVLQSFLGRARIYATEPARRRWEERARANIAAELASLRA